MALDEWDDRSHFISKIAIEAVIHAHLHGEPTSACKDGDDDRETQKVPGRESSMNRQALQSDPSRMMYPTPRSVWTKRGRPARSTLVRRYRTKTSRLFSLTSRSPQTSSMIRFRLTTRPAESIKHSRMENSVRVNSSLWPARTASRFSVSRKRSLKRICCALLSEEARVRARTRASSTSKANGLVR